VLPVLLGLALAVTPWAASGRAGFWARPEILAKFQWVHC